MANWGTELWDQREILEKHTHNGIDFFDKCSNFMKERVRIEQEYAKSLRKLVKQYQFKKKEEEDLPYTYQHAFKSFLQENDDFAGQREVIAEEVQNNIFKEMHKLSAERKVNRRNTFKKMTEFKNALDQHHGSLLSSKRKYHSASEDAANACKAYEQAAQSLDLTKAQILKFQKTYGEKGSLKEKATEEYQMSLENFNSKQTLHYEGEMPDIINIELQAQEENLIERLSSFLKEFSSIQQKVSPIISKCFEGMTDAAKLCDPSKDSETFVERNKSGDLHPGDIEFEEFGKPPPSASQADKQKAKTIKPSLFNTNKKKDALSNDGIANDYADLPPAQRKIKFNKAISALQDQLNQLEKQNAGMVKLMENNAKFGGDTNTIQDQIDANQKEIDKVKPLLHQYQCYLAAAMEGDAARKNSSRPNSDGTGTAVVPVPAVPQNETVDDSELPPPPPPPPPPPSDESYPPADEFDDEMRCSVLYDFSGTNEGELSVYAGEELILIDDDDGSGWTRVTRGDEEGYIPSAYLEKI